MTERTSYLPGTPSWIDLGSPDTAASAAFFGGLLGWTAEIDPRPEAGGYGIIQDPNGSFISVWQPNEHIGAEPVNEPGTFTWNELTTPDLAATRAFYTAVFGWGVDPDAGADTATVFTVGGTMVWGAHVAGEDEFPAWSIWFSVDDCDASAARAVELGASILMPPTDMDFGRGAVVADPHGAVIGIGVMSATTLATAPA